MRTSLSGLETSKGGSVLNPECRTDAMRKGKNLLGGSKGEIQIKNRANWTLRFEIIKRAVAGGRGIIAVLKGSQKGRRTTEPLPVGSHEQY